MAARKRNTLLPASLPVGSAITVNGQRFDVLDIEPYVTKAGAQSQVVIWKSECLDCGEGFTEKLSVLKWPQARRCHLHRKKGPRQ